MAFELFGYRVGKADEEKQAIQIPSFAPKPNDDGAIELAPGGSYGTFVDLENSAKSEGDLVTRYRQMSHQPEIEQAINDVVNEAIISDNHALPVKIVLDELKVADRVKKRISEEFGNVLNLLDFSNMSYDIFRRWYIDGRVYYHMMIDEKKPREGIKELRYIDPRRIRKVRITKKPQTQLNSRNLPIAPAHEEYYIYNHAGVMNNGTATQGIRISPDSICHVHSGLLDERNRLVLSHLHKAIKPLNQLRMLEDATVIYRIARAPERRIFYIDVGNLPKMKAEQYLRDMMAKHKNRLVYNADTGEVRDDRKFMTMLEDYWLPRREGNRGTEITTLPGGQNLGQLDDVEYFRKKLYQSLNVPSSRNTSENTFNLGRSSEITRDEVKFTKFVTRLRARFSHIFDRFLETQLILTGVMSKEEWKQIRNHIRYDYLEDNFYSEIKEQEILTQRLNVLQVADTYVGKYYSQSWIRKNVLRQNEDEIQNIDDEMRSENVGAPSFDEVQPPQNQATPAKPTPAPMPKSEEIEVIDKPLSEEERVLIESMTKLINDVNHDESTD